MGKNVYRTPKPKTIHLGAVRKRCRETPARHTARLSEWLGWKTNLALPNAGQDVKQLGYFHSMDRRPMSKLC